MYRPHIYIVSNPSCDFRRQNMERRIANLDLSDSTTFVPGGDKQGPLVRHYALNLDSLGATACLIGHLKALRKFVEDGGSHGCIIEDDVLFRHDFKEKLIEYTDKYKDRNLIQLFCIGQAHDGDCQYGYYGTQGYIISRKYALEALSKYDRPTKYWPSEWFKTSEMITMYSGGICLSSDPIIIEDGLTYTLGDISREPNMHQRQYRMYSYSFGLLRYVECDPEFRIDAAVLSDGWEYFVRLDSTQLWKVLQLVNDTENKVLLIRCALLQMLSGWYNDKVEARKWADIFFTLISEGQYSQLIYQHQKIICEIARFYEPSFSRRIGVRYDPSEIGWDNEYNWIKIPNAPYAKVSCSGSNNTLAEMA